MIQTLAIKKLSAFASSTATALKKMGSPLWRILTFSPADDLISQRKTLCVSIEKGSLATVFGSRVLSKIKIKGFRSYAFGEERYAQPGELASSVTIAINRLRASRAEITLSIPKSWVIIKTAEFPSTVKEDLPNVVFYELDRLTPLSPENAYYDFRILEEHNEKIVVVIMAAKADSIQPYLDALRENGITVSRITVNLSGIGTLCNYSNKTADFTLVEIDEHGYEGASFHNGFLTDAFTGAFTEEDMVSRVDTIARELTPLMEAAKPQGSSPQVVFHLKDRSPHLIDLLKQKIVFPFKVLDEPDKKFKFQEPQSEVSFAAVGGVIESLWTKSKGLNLLRKGIYEKPKKPMVLTLILILTIMLALALYLIAPLKVQEKRLKEIDNQITMRKDEVRKVQTLKKEIEAVSNEIATIENFKISRTSSQDIFKELTKILPKNAWLTRVKISAATVDIEGYASSATGLLPTLEASQFFRKAEFASHTFRDARLNADRFVIKMEIEAVKTQKTEKVEDEEE